MKYETKDENGNEVIVTLDKFVDGKGKKIKITKEQWKSFVENNLELQRELKGE